MDVIIGIKKIFQTFSFKFDREIEKKFLESYIEKSLPVIRIGYLLCIFLYGIFGVLDIWIVPETKNIAWFIRFAIVIPVLVLIISISFCNFFKRYNQLLLVVSSAVVGLGIVAMISYSKPNELGYKYYYTGLILVMIWIYTFIRLRFWNSMISGLIITLGYEIVAIFIQHLTNSGIESENMLIFLNNNFFFISANILGLFASYHIEELHRSDFLHKQTIILQNIELHDINAAKDKLLSIIAHDLKNPFNSILGFSELLLINHSKYDNQKREKQIKIIYNTSKNTYRLLENLLTWASSQSGKIEMKKEKCNLKSLAQEIIVLISETANSKKINVINAIYEDIIILADKSMLNSIIRNLITNSIKYTKENGEIIIDAKIKDRLVELSIKDNGIGMDEKIKKSLFKIGETKSGLGTQGEQGTGLGLILCKEFVEKHEGKIWVTSEIGKGSEFIFTIPILQ